MAAQGGLISSGAAAAQWSDFSAGPSKGVPCEMAAQHVRNTSIALFRRPAALRCQPFAFRVQIPNRWSEFSAGPRKGDVTVAKWQRSMSVTHPCTFPPACCAARCAARCAASHFRVQQIPNRWSDFSAGPRKGA